MRKKNIKITKCPNCGSDRIIVSGGGCCGRRKKYKCEACGWKG